MDHPQPTTAPEFEVRQPPQGDLPPGNHALEVGARAGIGPLSPLGREVWHGHARPCVSCGQLVRRDAPTCDSCGQDLSQGMLDKMRTHAGPWYVLEHVRPFPGVSLERIIRQVRRGLITETAIIRGPSTDHQWRFAGETPGLCRYFGRCWNCHRAVTPADTHCSSCHASLLFDPNQAAVTIPPQPKHNEKTGGPRASAPHPSPPPTPAAAPTPFEELRKLSAAVDRTDLPAPDLLWDEPPRIAGFRATWVAVAVLTVLIVVLLWLTQ